MARTVPAGGKEEAMDGQAGSLVLMVADTARGVEASEPAKTSTEAVGEVQPHSAQPSESMSSTDFDDWLTYCEEHPDSWLLSEVISIGQTLGLLPMSACPVAFPLVADALAAAAAGRARELPAAGALLASPPAMMVSAVTHPFCPVADALEAWEAPRATAPLVRFARRWQLRREHRPAPPPPYRWGGLSKRMLGAGR